MRRLFFTLWMVSSTVLMYAAGPDKGFSISSPGLTMEISCTADGAGAHIAAGNEPVFRSSSLPLFEVWVCKGETVYELTSKEGWDSITTEKKGKCYYMTFTGAESVPGAEDLSLSLTISKGKGNDWWESSAISLSWTGRTMPEGLELRNAVLMPVSFENVSSDSRVFYPYSSGLVNDPAENCHRHIRYPSGFGASMPYFAFYDKKGNGLYIGAHDKDATIKDLIIDLNANARQAVKFSYPSVMGDDGKFDLAPCEIVLAGFEGDWFDASVMFREWMKKESSWYPADRMDKDGRTDTPQWMKELCVWINGTDAGAIEFQKKFGIPIGLHWYNWHKIPFDNDYPHYFPARDGFKDKVAKLKENNVYVMPYINGRLWDVRDRGTTDYLFTSLALPSVTKKKDGSYISEQYGSYEADGSPVSLGVMCPTTDTWQNKMAEVVLNLLGEGGGVNGVYMDQIAAAPAVECFDVSHDHPAGGGTWWTHGYRELLQNIREQMPEGSILTTESNADGFIDGFDGYLVWQFRHNGQVPAFGAVYGGIIQLFGRTYNSLSHKDTNPVVANKMTMAQSFVAGEQLGWFGASLLNDKTMSDYLAPILKLRYRFRDYFYKGQMAKSPELTGDNPMHHVKWSFTGIMTPIQNPAVMCGAWEVPHEDKLLLMFANHSTDSITLDVEYPVEKWGMNMKKCQIVRYDPDSSQQLEALPSRITFAPDEVFVIELKK